MATRHVEAALVRSSGPTSSGMARYELISKIRETLCEVYGSSVDIAGAV